MGDRQALPRIAIVVIGLNVEKTLGRCLQSIQEVDYPEERLDVVYVDGGSSDRSLEVAEQFPRVRTHALNLKQPTPGAGRNAGAYHTCSEWIQFLDGDTVLDPDWLMNSVPVIDDPQIATISGRREELYPDRNTYHMIADLEWLRGDGECTEIGGDVLVRRSAFEEVGGYDPALIAGEDPDFSFRLRQLGYKLKVINRRMTGHDIAMHDFRQYWKRAYRSGHAFAEVGIRYFHAEEPFWKRQLLRIVGRPSLAGIGLILGLISQSLWLAILVPSALSLLPARQLSAVKTHHHLRWWQAFLYTIHLCIVVYPQFFGALRYLGTLFGAKSVSNGADGNAPMLMHKHQG